jgi:NADPH:quinone reductase-like Zn-dependent oxidoreductase
MAQITDNQAAWLPEEKARSMEVGPGPTPNPEENEVVIKVAYAAVNPTDWKVRLTYLLTEPLRLTKTHI